MFKKKKKMEHHHQHNLLKMMQSKDCNWTLLWIKLKKKSFSEIIYDTHSQGTNPKYLIFTHVIALLDDCS